MTFLTDVYFFYFGAIVGSFLNVVILRLPAGRTLKGRSHCMSCGHELSWIELVPLFSFLFLRGMCRNCGKRISWRYFGIELLTGLLFFLIWRNFAPHSVPAVFSFIGLLCFVSACIAIFFIDFEHYLILDKIIFPTLVVVLLCKVLAVVNTDQSALSVIGFSLLGAAVGCLPFFLLWLFSKGKWIGFGDVKLMLLLGFMAGFPLVVVTLFVSIFLGGASGILLLAFANKTLRSKVPFGTFLTVGAVVCLFYGQWILQWYLSMLGV